MTVRVYRSTDAGAPSLSGLAGSMINVLTACLVNGYGSLAPAGWLRPYTGTNIAVFRQPPGTNQRYLRVDETAPSTTGVRWTGFENMSSLTAGMGQFPLDWQASIFHFRGNTFGNSTPVPWMVVATERLFYMWVSVYQYPTTQSGQYCAVFGDIDSADPADTYNTILIGGTANAFATANNAPIVDVIHVYDTTSVTSGHYVSRAYHQQGSSIQVGKYVDAIYTGTQRIGQVEAMPFPSRNTGEIYLLPIRITEQTDAVRVLRGTLPGVLAPGFRVLNNMSDGDILNNISGLPGRTFEFKRIHSAGGGGASSGIFFEISNTW